MKIVAITGERRSELIDKPDPEPKHEFVVVQVRVAPMCTEYKSFRSGHESDVLGHEAAGQVTAVDRSTRIKEGDRVVAMPLYPCGRCALCLSGDYVHCQDSVEVHARTGNRCGTATYAQYLVKQDWMLLPLPEDISYEHGAMACCGLGPTFGAMERMEVNAFDTILVTGLGPVGLGGVINAAYRGCRVIAVEPHPMRRQLALDLGAEEAIDPSDGDPVVALLDLTDGKGVDKAVDCTGEAPAWRLAIDGLRRRGQMAFVGEGGSLEVKVSQDMIRKGLSVHGCWHWNLTGAGRMIQLIRQTRDKLDKLITHQFPMSEVQEAFELQLTGRCGKVLLDPWG